MTAFTATAETGRPAGLVTLRDAAVALPWLGFWFAVYKMYSLAVIAAWACGALAIAGLLGLLLCTWLQRRHAAIALMRVDAACSEFNTAGFTSRGDRLLAGCQRTGKPLSVAIFDFADLQEARNLYGKRFRREAVSRIVAKLGLLTSAGGFAARTGSTEFTVVLPRMGRDKALARIQRVLGTPTRIEFGTEHQEVVLVPDFLIETADGATDSVGELHRDLRRDLAGMRAHEVRRCQHMRRERERHSRPASIPGELQALPTAAP